MKKVNIQLNEFICEGRPTTQEDNHGGILDRYDLFLMLPSANTVGEEKEKTQMGKLVKYMNGAFAVFYMVQGVTVRHDFTSFYVKFSN